MPITTLNYNGKEELTMAQFEALETLDTETDYDIIDYPTTSITNTQMVFALTCKRLFPINTIFICSDDGNYIKDHTYKIEGSPKKWTDITQDISNKLNKLNNSEINRVYVRTTNGEDTSLPFTYTAEANSIAKRSASGTLAVETPTQEQDATTKKYVDQRFLTGTSDPTTATVGYQIGSVYTNTTTGDNFILEAINSSNGTYTWEKLLKNRDMPKSVNVTQEQYDALVAAGTVDENTYYYILEE